MLGVICHPGVRPIPGEEGKQSTPEWQRWHGGDPAYTAKFLSGSALPQYIGVCPRAFGPACMPPAKFAVWLAAVNGVDPHPAAVAVPTELNKSAMQKGHDKEDVVRELMFVETGYSFAPSDCYECVEMPWLRASPDGEVLMKTKDDHNEVVILEVKNKLHPPYGGAFPDAPDPQYYWQCVFNMFVTKADACVLVVAYTRDDAYLVGPKREEHVKMADAWAAHRAKGGKGATEYKVWTIYRNDVAVRTAVKFVEQCRLVVATAHERKTPGMLDPVVLASTFVDGMLVSFRAKGLEVDLTPGPASMGVYRQGFDTDHFQKGAGLAALFAG